MYKQKSTRKLDEKRVYFLMNASIREKIESIAQNWTKYQPF